MLKPPAEPPAGVRLNKVIADSGYCARRKADELILTGRVQVNGQTVQVLGQRINPETDHVTVDGKPLPKAIKRYGLFHKSRGYVTSRKAGKSQKTIYTLLPEEWQAADPAGRLDQDSSGLLILSTDGDFLHRIMHPSFHWPKVYEVQLSKPLPREGMQRLKEGILLEPEHKWARMEEITPIKHAPNTYRMTLVTGYNRQIRRSVEAVGNAVLLLKRVSFGSAQLGELPEGHIRQLQPAEVEALRSSPSRSQPKERQHCPQNQDGQMKHNH